VTVVVNGRRKPSAAKRGPAGFLPGDVRGELSLAPVSPLRRASRSWVAELKSFGERGGSLIGAAYALAAGSVMHRIEQLEDLNAERRFGQRQQTSPSVGAPAGSASTPSRTSL
jgi:hypothetical protein